MLIESPLSAPIGPDVDLTTLVGSAVPRRFTAPMRELTPETTNGFAVVEFARDVLKQPLLPWQEFAVIHGGELREDGRPRFGIVLVLVARQGGKTHLCRVQSLFWLTREKWPLILGTSNKLATAKEPWSRAARDMETNAKLSPFLPPGRGRGSSIRYANGQECIETVDGCRYLIAAANRDGGRGLSIDRLIADEVCTHHTTDAWNAAIPAMDARPHSQAWAITSMGDDRSIVLNDLHAAALAGSDPNICLLEWSAPEGLDVDDPRGWIAANPNLGHGIKVDKYAGYAANAKQAGGRVEADFRVERLCQRVPKLNAAVSPTRWAQGAVEGDLDEVRDRIALCLDVAPDELHATLVAAAVIDDVTRIEIVESWDGHGCIDALRRDLPGIVERINPRSLGWFPAGPAATLAVDLGKNRKVGWPPPRCVVEEIRAEIAAVCMGFAEQVGAGKILHLPGDALLDGHVLGAEKLNRDGTWVFSRKGAGHCDAAYAAAGAVHLARTLPKARRTRVVVSSEVARELAKVA